MTCDQLRPDYVPFAMGVLAEPENSEIREHCARGCDACTAGVREARALLYAIGASSQGAQPSAEVRRRIVASVAPVRQTQWHWRSAWHAGALTAAAAFLVFLLTGQRHAAEIAQLQRSVRQQTMAAALYREALDLLKAPETRQVTFGEGKPEPPKGRVFVNPTSGVLLIASHLAPPPSGKTYEMWIVPKSGKPAPAGLFSSDQDQTAVHFFRGSIPPSTTGAIAVTLERAGGVDAPTSTPLIVAAL